MTIDNINIEEIVEQVKSQIAGEKDLSPALKASLDLLLLLVTTSLGTGWGSIVQTAVSRHRQIRIARGSQKAKAIESRADSKDVAEQHYNPLTIPMKSRFSRLIEGATLKASTGGS